MSDYCIPLDIQEEIITRLPVKYVIRCTSVSKQWKSLINSSKFISNYHQICNIQPHHLLISYPKHKPWTEYVSVVDDDTFPKQKFSLPLPVFASPHTINLIGSSQGLLCFSYYPCGDMIAVIWNPTIRKFVDIVVPNVLDTNHIQQDFKIVIGFGVLPHTSDPMLVKIKCIEDIGKIDTATAIPWQVEVFKLSSGAWRSPSSINQPCKPIELRNKQVVINGFIYWLAYDRYFVTIIVSFDMKSEEFKEVHLPDSFAKDLSISKLRESLVVIENRYSCGFHIWTMYNGDPKSLAMKFTVSYYTRGKCISNVRGFRKNGEPLIEIGWEKERTLFVYEPNSKRISHLGISGRRVTPYMETLLLLDY